jgi:hypothetical protein
MNVENTPEFARFLAACAALIEDYRAVNFPSLPPETLEVEVGSKFIRIVRRKNPSLGGSVYAFVARMDNTTKALGTVLAGDVLKPATYAAPAKHARGNIFDVMGGMALMGPYGPAYL